MNNNTKASKKTEKVNNEKEAKKTVTIEQLKETFAELKDVKKTAEALSLQYVKAHWTNEGEHIPNSGTRCHLVFNGEDFDDDKLYMLSTGSKKERKTTTSHKTTTDPDELERQADELERQAKEKREKASEIRAQNKALEDFATSNGCSVEEAKEMIKVRDRMRAKMAKATANA